MGYAENFGTILNAILQCSIWFVNGFKFVFHIFMTPFADWFYQIAEWVEIFNDILPEGLGYIIGSELFSLVFNSIGKVSEALYIGRLPFVFIMLGFGVVFYVFIALYNWLKELIPFA